MLKTRILTALIGIPIVIGLILYGGYPLLAAAVIVTIFALDELSRALNRMHLYYSRLLGFLNVIMLVISTYFFGHVIFSEVFFILIVINFIYFIYKFPAINFAGVSITLISSIYVGYLFSFILLIRDLQYGAYLLLITFILTWAADVGAYAVGRSVGKNKLHKSISPNKTVEGAVGGIVFPAVIAGLAFQFIPFNVNSGIIQPVILGILIGIIGQIGDLIASAIKRQADIKDFGYIIPGHGGMMDRFDSLLLTAPLAYYFLTVFIIN